MEILIFIVVIIALGLLVGLLSRKKGDGALDTIGAGCKGMFGCLFFVIIIVVVLIVAFANGAFN